MILINWNISYSSDIEKICDIAYKNQYYSTVEIMSELNRS